MAEPQNGACFDRVVIIGACFRRCRDLSDTKPFCVSQLLDLGGVRASEKFCRAELGAARALSHV